MVASHIVFFLATDQNKLNFITESSERQMASCNSFAISDDELNVDIVYVIGEKTW